MTTMHEEEMSCAVCGATQTVMELGSTNSFGSMDLDTRLPRNPTGRFLRPAPGSGRRQVVQGF